MVCGRDARSVDSVSRTIGAEPLVLDLADLAAVRKAATTLRRVQAVACNAGVQNITSARLTPDGFEETFQINHLAHVALVDGLLSHDASLERIVWIGSATHDPDQRTGTPPPDEGLVEGYARDAERGGAREGMRRYVTTKLLAVATSSALAREHPELHVTAFDPGLMPGTGLARQRSAAFRALWGSALKGLRVLPFASSPTASARSLAALLVNAPPPVPSGSYVDHRLRPIRRARRAQDVAYQDGVLAGSRALLRA